MPFQSFDKALIQIQLELFQRTVLGNNTILKINTLPRSYTVIHFDDGVVHLYSNVLSVVHLPYFCDQNEPYINQKNTGSLGIDGHYCSGGRKGCKIQVAVVGSFLR